ncbi:TPA: 50S ribosomal protein L44e [archaeon]|nr:50S ribosomal protein L44e [Candidatus Naiadarchaeales archaeon SRR2090153.bin461]HIK02472.1 50S ribosomal protein L44e [Candidatus Naiadarchaeales archaeon SRR2090159.bin1288]
MKVPKTINMFCKWCKKHTAHTVGTVKKHTRRTLSLGQRRFRRKMRGYGGFPKPKPEGKKPTQRLDLRYTCKDCKHAETRSKTYRVKKFELTE